MATKLTDELRAGLATLRELPGIVTNGQPQWEPDTKRWSLSIGVTADVAHGGPIPETTQWYLLFDDAYPFGRLAMLPAKSGGIVQTFQHQRYNGIGNDSCPWRTGNICTETDAAGLRRSGYDSEPSEPEINLAWHLLRTQRWLELASREELVLPNDHYELPDIPSKEDLSVVFCEGPISHRQWSEVAARHGTADLTMLPTDPPILSVTAFSARNGRQEVDQEWNKPPPDGGRQAAAWIRLNAPPTLYPHQAPMTWGELREACRMTGRNLDTYLRTLVLKRAFDRDILLVGFPIQERVEGPVIRTHWLALKLPNEFRYTQKGFRTNEDGRWRAYRNLGIRDERGLEWIKTENWHSDEISSRGKLATEAAVQRTLIIGAGALGSALAEMMARGAAREITMMDKDDLEAGNLSRHTLLLGDLGKQKAGAVAKRLDQASIHGRIDAIQARFPPEDPVIVQRVRDHDVVIDCTGDDSVAAAMGRFPWGETKLFISISLGLYARRLYCFTARGTSFPATDFLTKVDAWLKEETAGLDIDELPRDGPGCWNFRHPARIDDVWMMAATAMRFLEQSVVHPPESPTLMVMEQQTDDSGNFIGTSIVS